MANDNNDNKPIFDGNPKAEENIDFSAFEQAEKTRKKKAIVTIIEMFIIFMSVLTIILSIINWHLSNLETNYDSAQMVILCSISIMTAIMVVLVCFKNYHYKE